MPLSTPEIKAEIVSLETVDSTNRYVIEHAETLADLTLVTADSQTAGRGRQGRVWISPPDQNVYATWLLKSWPYPAYQATWLASLALIHTIREFTDLPVRIKWPNDLLIGQRKLAGLLAECRSGEGACPIIALGMGINVNMSENDLLTIETPSISLFSASGMKINRSFFNESLAFHLVRLYLIGIHSGAETLYAEWRQYQALLNHPVIFTDPAGKKQRGIVQDVPFNGDIVLETDSGVKTYQCGDITFDKSSFPITI